MRIIFYFRAEILVDQGTPLRCRNLIRELVSREETQLLVISSDSSERAREVLGVEHMSVLGKSPAEARAQLWNAIEKHRADIVYGRFGTPRAMRRLTRPPAGPRPRFVADVHGVRAFEKLEHYWQPYWRRLAKATLARAGEFSQYEFMDGLTVVSSALRERLARLGKPIQVLWGGVDPSHFRPSGEPEPGATRVIYAGNFAPYQGISTLVAAGKRLLDRGLPYRFTFVGDIDRVPGVRGEVEDLLGASAEIRGPVPYDEIPRLLSTAHVLTIPRLANRTAHFGFPSKLPEYLAMGRPVVATHVGEHAKVIEHGKTGLIVPPEDPEVLARALEELGDSDLRERLGIAARAYAEERLSWSAMGDRLTGFLARFIDS